MSYNPAIPGPNDILAQSQAQIQTNFSQADSIFDINHITFDDATVAERGKHRKVDLKRIPAPGSVATEAVLYQKLSNGSSQIFMQRDGNATEIQLTGANPTAAATGCTFLPGGLKMNWGKVTVPVANGSVTATFNQAFTGDPFSVVATAINSSGTVNAIATVSGVLSNECTIRSNQNNDVYYIAIGRI